MNTIEEPDVDKLHIRDFAEGHRVTDVPMAECASYVAHKTKRNKVMMYMLDIEERDQGSALPTNLLGGGADGEVTDIINLVTSGNMFGLLGNIVQTHNWRVDRQNAPDDYVNISVQRNNVGAPSTVASVFVPGTLNIPPPAAGPQDPVHLSRMAELQRAVRHGLVVSYRSHTRTNLNPLITRYQVSGNFSN